MENVSIYTLCVEDAVRAHFKGNYAKLRWILPERNSYVRQNFCFKLKKIYGNLIIKTILPK